MPDNFVYTNTLYEINQSFVYFYVDPDSSERIEVPLNPVEHLVIDQIIVHESKEFREYNIMNLFYVLRSADPLIKGFVLSEDQKGTFLIRVTMYLGSEHNNVFIMDYDIGTGLCLAFLMEWPIFIPGELWEKRKI